MRLHHALNVYSRRLRGVVATAQEREVASAVVSKALQQFAQRGTPVRELAVEDIVNAAQAKLLRVAPECAAAALDDGPEADIADKQCGAYLRRTVDSVKADQIRRLQRRDKEAQTIEGAIEGETPSGPAAPQLDEAFLHDVKRLVGAEVIPRLARRAGPHHAERMIAEGRAAIDEMVDLQTGDRSVEQVLGVAHIDTEFDTKRGALYQRHCRLRARISATAAHMAKIQRSPTRPGFLLEPEDVVNIERWLQLLKRRS